MQLAIIFQNKFLVILRSKENLQKSREKWGLLLWGQIDAPFLPATLGLDDFKLHCKVKASNLSFGFTIEIKLWGIFCLLSLKDTLAHFKIRITPDFSATKMQRDGSQWMRCYTICGVQTVYFGDYKTGINEHWRGDTSHLTQDELKNWEKENRKAHTDMAKAREEEQVRVKNALQAEWETLIDRGTTPYLQRKKIDRLYGCRIAMNEHGPFLIVPARDIEGELWNFQRIYNQKLSAGDKFMKAGARVEGLFHCLTQIYPEGTLYLCEGFATAASISSALSDASSVIAAFNASNLSPVAKALRSKYPKARIVLCADNDQWVFKPDGRQWNPGLEAAKKAAGQVGATVIYPRFQNLESRPTDFNDLHCLEGLEAVKQQLLNPVEDAAGPTSNGSGNEASIVKDILDEYGEHILKMDRDIFFFRQTHWHHMDPLQAADFFYKRIDAMAGGKADHKKIMSAFNRLMRHIPSPPQGVDLFSPRPDCINLLNGTLHFKRRADRTFVHELREHDASDYLANLLPFNFEEPHKATYNQKLLGVLDKCFAGDPDAEAKKKAIQEMYGCVISGLFPGLFMLFGAPGTGKSTIANIARRLVGPGNSCSVPPTRWFGFHMWSMIGKQVNIDTDIPTVGKISDDMIKKVIEGVPVYVQRKQMSDVETRLPSANIFCANSLPPFVDGRSGAQARRWVFFHFLHSVIPAEKSYDRMYWDAVFDSDPQGVFNFALGGLLRLCENQGTFTAIESGQAQVKQWENESDDAGQAVKKFIDDVREGEAAIGQNLTLKLGAGLKIERPKLWEAFKSNYQSIALGYGGPEKSDVYAALQRAGFETKKIEGVWYFMGIGVKEAPNSEC